jgi:hypothetical protein
VRIRNLVAAATVTTAAMVPAVQLVEQVTPQPTAAAWSTVAAAACRSLHGVYVNNHCPGANPAYLAACHNVVIYGYGQARKIAEFGCAALAYGGSWS